MKLITYFVFKQLKLCFPMKREKIPYSQVSYPYLKAFSFTKPRDEQLSMLIWMIDKESRSAAIKVQIQNQNR